MRNKIKILVFIILLTFHINLVLSEENNTITNNKPSIDIDVGNYNLEEGENVDVSVVINSPYNINSGKIECGNGESEDFLLDGRIYGGGITCEYDGDGDYYIHVTINTENGTFEEISDKISVEKIEIQDLCPKVDLLNPSNNTLLKNNKVSFKFSAWDDFELEECSLELYSKNPRNLEFSEKFSDLSNDEDVVYNLEDFDDGNYTWKIYCKDNSNQETSSNEWFFQVQTVLHDKEKEIAGLILNLRTFIDKKNNFGLEERDAIEDLDKIIDLDYYSKKLPQIDQDLGVNLKFVSDENLRKEKKADALRELERIKNSIPKDFEIIESDKFIKNSVIDSLYDVTKNYVLAKGIILSDWKIKNLAKANLKIQSRFSVTTEIKKIHIKYNNSDRNLILVKKKFDIADEVYNYVLEILPDFDVVFLNDVEELGNGLYGIDVNKLEDFELIYYIESDSNIDDLRKVESVLFHEFPISSLGITGYFSFSDGIGENSSYLIFIFFIIGLIGYFGYNNMWIFQMQKWKKEENVRVVIGFINHSDNAIKFGDFARAKDNYHKIKRIYGLLPEGFRKYSYNKIERIRVALDKAEIAGLVREYESNKRVGNKSRSDILYKKIQEKYRRLPRKYQEKVYRRLCSDGFRF